MFFLPETVLKFRALKKPAQLAVISSLEKVLPLLPRVMHCVQMSLLRSASCCHSWRHYCRQNVADCPKILERMLQAPAPVLPPRLTWNSSVLPGVLELG